MLGNVEKNKALLERYPFLLPRNVWTYEVPTDYDYTYIEGDYEFPQGWHNLFLQMCEDIRQPLIEANQLDKFRFTELKEKYGQLRIYTGETTDEILTIIEKYEYVSQFVCCHCGKPAKYMSRGYICPYCEGCIKKERYHYQDIKFNPIMKITQFSTEGSKELEIDCSDIWERLYANK